MLQTILIHSLVVFFLYWMVRYSIIFRTMRNNIKLNWIPDNPISYILQCALCFSFWLVLIVGGAGLVFSAVEVGCVPIIVMFIDLLYRKLGGGEQD
jgi:hypothetical protein